MRPHPSSISVPFLRSKYLHTLKSVMMSGPECARPGQWPVRNVAHANWDSRLIARGSEADPLAAGHEIHRRLTSSNSQVHAPTPAVLSVGWVSLWLGFRSSSTSLYYGAKLRDVLQPEHLLK